eukprot:CAMPEP_0168377686 /NCGR_PEP_ID=MMETSP0228-20121227/10952_1 /TAXON_ID=133427 /ORGANISM="Protoceratium reticulatum, Strain CCCM 535 (=CCMP 1889)" /LENGTH=1210 /DNA_ID=CAMNT_0008390687 /DNA_START=59 /DNA_END=3691 /DNA_ORIENTATION=+
MAGDIEPATKDEPRQGHRKITWAHCPHWLSWVLVVVLVLDKAGVITLPFGVHPAEGDALGVRALKERRLGGEVLAFSGGPRQLTAGSTGDHASNYTECHGGNQDSNHTGNHAGNHTGNHSETGHGEAHSDAHTGSHTEHAHPHYTLMFLFTAFIIGAAVTHLTTFPQFHSMQFTVVLFVLGMIYSFIFSQLGVGGISGSSYDMWMAIDPHLLLYTLLPVLLMGDAMTIDTGVVRRVAGQCLYLAGPGVLIGTFATAGFLYLYFHWMRGWPFELCMTLGSILAATDPVAVVGLLKELGASPTLTIIIQGESLLNDGTAIVLYLLSYDALKGHVPDIADIVIFLIKTAGLAVFAGICIGWFFCLWIRAASSRFNHNSTTIQICLTLCCAYTSFFMAEAVFEISGVLSCVAAALVLADNMWPSIVHKEALEEVWHMFEYLGNSLIFFLAGAKVGQSAQDIVWQDFFHLLLIYVVCVLIRGTMIFASRPLLKWLSKDRIEVSMADAAVMTWGGLRGAVGLALAVQVNRGRIENNISEEQADGVLFYTAGMACLTLLVNATTSPLLVRTLGVTKTPAAKQRMLLSIQSQLQRIEDSKDHPPVVQEAIREILKQARDHVERRTKMAISKDLSRIGSVLQQLLMRKQVCIEAEDVVSELEEARARFERIEPTRLRLLQAPPLFDLSASEEELAAAGQDQVCEADMVQAMNEAFLMLVRNEYWHLIEAGEFVSGSPDAETLLYSVRLGLDHAAEALTDLHHLRSRLKLKFEKVVMRTSLVAGARQQQRLRAEAGTCRDSDKSMMTSTASEEVPVVGSATQGSTNTYGGHTASARFSSMAMDVSNLLVRRDHGKGPLHKFIESWPFSAFMVAMILLNALYILLEQLLSGDNSANTPLTWVAEIFFCGIFTLEFVMKIAALRFSYFGSGWNIFDFVLVVLGIVGIVLEGILQGMTADDGGAVSTEARLFRVNRVFRVLRIMRLVRLVNFVRRMHAALFQRDYSLELSEHLQSINVLSAFVKGHARAQEKLLDYFGCDGKPAGPEAALCLCQSRTEVYKALDLAAEEITFIDRNVLKGINLQRKTFQAAKELSDFILEAHQSGVVTGRMAETVLHPLRDNMRVLDGTLRDTIRGLRRRGRRSHGSAVVEALDAAADTDEGHHEGHPADWRPHDWDDDSTSVFSVDREHHHGLSLQAGKDSARSDGSKASAKKSFGVISGDV